MAGVQEADDGVRNIALERLGARRKKERVVLAPHRQQRRFICAEVFLECGIKRDIASVIAEQLELDFIGAGTGQIKVVEALTIRRNYCRIGHAVGVLPMSRLRGKEGPKRVSVRDR